MLDRRSFLAATAGILAASEFAAAHPVEVDPKYRRQLVSYNPGEPPGTILVDPQHRFLFLLFPQGEALRYGVGVGRQGFSWAGSRPDWPKGKVAHLDAHKEHDPAGPEARSLGGWNGGRIE